MFVEFALLLLANHVSNLCYYNGFLLSYSAVFPLRAHIGIAAIRVSLHLSITLSPDGKLVEASNLVKIFPVA